MATVCPYCNIEVSESSIEAEDGCCPECGSIISATSSFLGEDEDEDDDTEEQDIFSDLDDEDEFERDEFDDDVFDDEEFDDEEFDDEEFDEEEEEEEF